MGDSTDVQVLLMTHASVIVKVELMASVPTLCAPKCPNGLYCPLESDKGLDLVAECSGS